MRNRAKCKLCKDVIESFHSQDYVQCKCSEISVFGKDSLKCSAKDWNNFLRVDDQDNEIVVSVKEEIKSEVLESKPKKKELLSMLDEMIKNIEKLPPHAMNAPITHFDYCSALLLLSAIFRSDCKEEI